MKKSVLSFIALFSVVNLIAQKQHAIYIGTNYTLYHQNHPRHHITYEEAQRALGTGPFGNLNYKVTQIPLLAAGYLFSGNFRNSKNFGFYAGAEFNSSYTKYQVKQDDGYNEFYSWWGFYPYSGIRTSTLLTTYINAGLHYLLNRVVVATGLSTILAQKEFSNMYSNKDEFLLNRLVHARVTFDITKSLAAYVNMRTTLQKEYYSRPVYTGIGIQYNFTENR